MASNCSVFESVLAEVLLSLKEKGFDFVLKDEQRTAIKQLYDKKDLVAVLPTGYGKSLIFQLLVLVLDYIAKKEAKDRPILLVVTPLVSIIKDQIKEVEDLGISACHLAENLDTLEDMLNVNIVYSSAESAIDAKFLEFLKKNSKFCQRIMACIIDESHTIDSWTGIREEKLKSVRKSRRHTQAFRGAYGQLSLLRSFLPLGTPMAALTGTADVQTQKIVCSQLALRDPLKLYISPNRKNIRFSVVKVKKAEMFTKLLWLVENIKSKGENCEKTLVFCNKMNDIAYVANYLMTQLGGHAYSPATSRLVTDCLIGIYHSASWPKTKECIQKSLKGEGKARVVVCSTALSMGDNFPDIHYVINWGPPRTLLDLHQEIGRAGRDGKQSHSLFIFHGQQLGLCESGIKEFANSSGCLRVAAYKNLDPNITPLQPLHDCCDSCAKNCKCCTLCKYVAIHETPSAGEELHIQYLSRAVTDQDKNDLKDALLELKESYEIAPFFNGFSDKVIEEVVGNCSTLFTLNDIMDKCCVYSIAHSLKILEVLQEIFLDIPNFDETMNILDLATSAAGVPHINMENVFEDMDLLLNVLRDIDDQLSPDEDA